MKSSKLCCWLEILFVFLAVYEFKADHLKHHEGEEYYKLCFRSHPFRMLINTLCKLLCLIIDYANKICLNQSRSFVFVETYSASFSTLTKIGNLTMLDIMHNVINNSNIDNIGLLEYRFTIT